MTLTELKIYAMSQAAEMNIPALARTDMLNRIKNADQYQTMGFVLDGKIYDMNEKGQQAIKERFIEESKMDLTKKLILHKIKTKNSFLKAIRDQYKKIIDAGKGFKQNPKELLKLQKEKEKAIQRVMKQFETSLKK